jgi:hypothetical protein
VVSGPGSSSPPTSRSAGSRSDPPEARAVAVLLRTHLRPHFLLAPYPMPRSPPVGRRVASILGPAGGTKRTIYCVRKPAGTRRYRGSRASAGFFAGRQEPRADRQGLPFRRNGRFGNETTVHDRRNAVAPRGIPPAQFGPTSVPPAALGVCPHTVRPPPRAMTVRCAGPTGTPPGRRRAAGEGSSSCRGNGAREDNGCSRPSGIPKKRAGARGPHGPHRRALHGRPVEHENAPFVSSTNAGTPQYEPGGWVLRGRRPFLLLPPSSPRPGAASPSALRRDVRRPRMWKWVGPSAWWPRAGGC